MHQLNGRPDAESVGELPRVSLAEAATEFADGVAALSHNTQREYGRALAQLIEHIGPDRALASIAATELEQLTADRLEQASPNTVAKDARGWTRFFTWALRRGYVRANPIAQMTSRPVGRRGEPARLPTLKEMDRLLGACPPPMRLPLRLVTASGLDRGVVAAIRPSQFDLADATLRVRRHKTGKLLTLPIHPGLLDELGELLGQQTADMALWPTLTHRRWWTDARKAAKLDWLTFVALRKWASNRLQKLMPLSQVRDLLGHSSVTVTADYYSQLDPAAIARLGELALPAAPARGQLRLVARE